MIKYSPAETDKMLRNIEKTIKKGRHKTVIITVKAYHSQPDGERIAGNFSVVVDDDSKPIRSLEEFIDDYFLDRGMVALDIVDFRTY